MLLLVVVNRDPKGSVWLFGVRVEPSRDPSGLGLESSRDSSESLGMGRLGKIDPEYM